MSGECRRRAHNAATGRATGRLRARERERAGGGGEGRGRGGAGRKLTAGLVGRHDTFSNPMEDVAPMKEYECIRAQLSGIVNEAPQDTGPQLIFADSETAARGMARALGFSRELDGTRWTGDKNLGQALQSGLEEMRRELAEAVAANLCEETDPDERLKTCFTQTPGLCLCICVCMHLSNCRGRVYRVFRNNGA